MARKLENRLKSKGFPVEVYYGPDYRNREPNRTCIIVERTANTSDAFRAATGIQRNPRRIANRFVSADVHVFAKASVAGARKSEHENLADVLIDAVHVGLFRWGQECRQPVEFTGGRFWDEADLEGSRYKQWPGVIYTMTVQVARGISDINFAGEGLAEVTLDDINHNTTEVN